MISPDPIGGIDSKTLIAPGIGGWILSTEIGPVGSDKYGQTYDGVGAWVTPVAADGERGTPIRLAYRSQGGVGSPVGAIRDDGRFAIAWSVSGVARVIEGRVGQPLPVSRTLGPRRFFLPGGLAFAEGRLLAIGQAEGGMVLWTEGRATRLGRYHAATIAARDGTGAIVGLVSHRESAIARLSSRGSLVKHQRVGRGYTTAPAVDIAASGRSVAVAASFPPPDDSGSTIRVLGLRRDGSRAWSSVLTRHASPGSSLEVDVQADGRFAAAFETAARARLVFGRATGKLRGRHTVGSPRAATGDVSLASAGPGRWLLGWVKEQDFHSFLEIRTWSFDTPAGPVHRAYGPATYAD